MWCGFFHTSRDGSSKRYTLEIPWNLIQNLTNMLWKISCPVSKPFHRATFKECSVCQIAVDVCILCSCFWVDRPKSLKWGVPFSTGVNGSFIMENPIKMDDVGVPLFTKHHSYTGKVPRQSQPMDAFHVPGPADCQLLWHAEGSWLRGTFRQIPWLFRMDMVIF